MLFLFPNWNLIFQWKSNYISSLCVRSSYNGLDYNPCIMFIIILGKEFSMVFFITHINAWVCVCADASSFCETTLQFYLSLERWSEYIVILAVIGNQYCSKLSSTNISSWKYIVVSCVCEQKGKFEFSQPFFIWIITLNTKGESALLNFVMFFGVKVFIADMMDFFCVDMAKPGFSLF